MVLLIRNRLSYLLIVLSCLSGCKESTRVPSPNAAMQPSVPTVPVAGLISKVKLAEPAVLNAENSVQGDVESAVSGEFVLTMPTSEVFDANLFRIEGLPWLETYPVNEEGIIVRRDLYNTTYVVPYSGALILDDSLIDTPSTTGKLFYGDVSCHLHLITNHFPEWTLSGGRTKSACVIIDDNVIPNFITVLHARNQLFSIQKAGLKDVPFLNVSVQGVTVRFARNGKICSVGADIESKLLLDIKRSQDGVIVSLEFPFKLHCREAQAIDEETK